MTAWLADPNLLFGLLLAALFVSVLAALTPGTGFLELLATGLWILVAMGLLRVSVRLWAAGLLVLAGVPFVAYLRTRRPPWMAGTLALLVLGAVLLFRPQEGQGLLGLHPLWAASGSLLFALTLWFGAQKITEALHRPRLMDLSDLEEQVGITRTPVHHEGTVYIAGELWSARSARPLPAGIRVRVVRREGLTLWVEPVQPEETSEPEAPRG